MSHALKGGKNEPVAKAGKYIAGSKGRETNPSARRENMLHAVKGGKTWNQFLRRENMWQVNEPVAKAVKHGTYSKWRENEPNVSQKQKLERNFVERQFLSKFIHAVISYLKC